MKASLIDAFGSSPESWVQKWTPTAPFTNCFLMRNPNIKNREIFTYADDQEAGVLPASSNFVASLRQAFTSVDLVGRHFPDPGRSFDEMMKLNDGGATWIATHLAPVCRADVKAMQMRARIEQVRRQVANAIGPFYVPTDATARVAARQEIARQIITELRGKPIPNNRFGLFLSRLLIDPGDLSDRLYETVIGRPGAQDQKSVTEAPHRVAPPAPEPEAPVPWELAGETLPATAPLPAAPPEYNPATALASRTHPAFLVRTGMGIWFDHLYRCAGDELFARDSLLATSTVQEIVSEISKAAIRLHLASRVLDEIEKLTFIDRQDERLAKASGTMEHRFNQFVMHLGYGLLPESERPTVNWRDGKRPVFASRPDNWSADNLPTAPRPFRLTYLTDWQHALYQAFSDNARGEPGFARNIEQNERLGRILLSIGANEA
jgi:hypothetical protein